MFCFSTLFSLLKASNVIAIAYTRRRCPRVLLCSRAGRPAVAAVIAKDNKRVNLDSAELLPGPVLRVRGKRNPGAAHKGGSKMRIHPVFRRAHKELYPKGVFKPFRHQFFQGAFNARKKTIEILSFYPCILLTVHRCRENFWLLSSVIPDWAEGGS